jgi:hypothetical protein
MSAPVYHAVLWVLALLLGILTLPAEAPGGRVRAKEAQEGASSGEAES